MQLSLELAAVAAAVAVAMDLPLEGLEEQVVQQ
jgi:hypothetical protein